MLRKQSFHVRLDLEDKPLDFLEYLIENSYSVVCVHEVAKETEKPHYHIIVEGYIYKTTALQNNIKKLTGCSGSSYSTHHLTQYKYESEKKTVQGGYQYIFKGDHKHDIPEPCYNYKKPNNINAKSKLIEHVSEEQIEEYHYAFWKINHEIKKEHEKKDKSPPCLKIWNKLIEDEFFEKNKFSNYKLKHYIIVDYYKRHCSIPAMSNIDGMLRYLFLRYLIEYEKYTLEQAVDYLLQVHFQHTTFREEGVQDHNCCQCHLDDIEQYIDKEDLARHIQIETI